MFGLTNLFIRLFGLDAAKASRYTLIAVAVGALIIILGFGWLFRGCGKRKAIQIDEQSLQKVNSENEKERKKELQVIVENNADTIKTVDERTEIQNINVVEKNAEIDTKIADADKKIQAAKSQTGDVTSEQLEKILLGQ